MYPIRTRARVRTGLVVAVAVMLLVGMTTPATAATLYVNGTTGDDAWDGRCETWVGGTCGPKATIQAGINAAADGDEVVIADGTYAGDGNRDLHFAGRSVTVRGASGDPSACVIDCEGNAEDPHRGFYFHGEESPDSTISGLTITNGDVTRADPVNLNGGGVLCDDSDATIINCMITGNAAARGGGVYRVGMSTITITNCTIAGNSAVYHGGGICGIMGRLAVTNCTIRGNSASYDGGGVFCYYGDLSVTNCTITGNAAASDGGGLFYRGEDSATITNCILWGDTPEEIYVHSGNPVLTYCDVQGGWEGEGNIDADPLFTDPNGDDYRLSTFSPCIDSGNTNAVPADAQDLDRDGDTAERVPIDLAEVPRFVDDTSMADAGVSDPPDYPEVVDMGAYERVPLRPWSVAPHAPSGAFPGGAIEMQIHPNRGLVEPRDQDPTGMFFRLVFVEDVSPDTFTVIVSPDPGLTATLSAGATANELTLAFDGVFPTGRYEITLDSGSDRTHTFPICFAEGDVNCSGDSTGLDLALIQHATNWNLDLSTAADLRADVNRDGQVTALDLQVVQTPENWNQPIPPLTCTCP